MDFVVQKYGGTSVGSLERINRVADHVAATRAGGVNVVVVVSAMGEQTDDLIDMARALSKDPPRRELDMLLTAGERITMALLSIALHERGLKSVSLTGSQSGILTDETHGNARIEKILGDRIRTGLQENSIVIVAGFQGVSPKTKEITTLGRGGSDLSAVALASVLGAQRCELYKDVDGVFTADPRVVPGARKIDSLPWYAMSELAWAGAGVLHARAAHVAARFGLVAEIRSSFKPQLGGTLIEPATGLDVDMSTSKHGMEQATLHAIASKSKMCLLEIETGAGDAVKLNPAVLEFLWANGEAPAVNQQVGSVTRLVVPENLAAAIKDGLAGGRFAAVRAKSVKLSMAGMSAVTVVGNGFLQNPETVAQLLSAASTAGEVMLWDVRNHALMVGVKDAEAPKVVQALHALF
ncbi:MAG: aspartokinase [Pseudomonadota bacterium]